MRYQLGVDLGTTYSAAAVGRGGRVEVTTLGTANPVMPSVVLLRADGEVLVGEVAVRRGLAEPTRLAREFKRRLGDPTPLVLGGTPYGAEALMGHLLRAVLATVTEREGEPPEHLVLTHPANFGPYKIEQMHEVARLGGADLDRTSFLSEPQAAALSYASRNRVDDGEVVAIYDFGGGTFDAALVRRNGDGFELIGRPEGMERFGGIDIDAALIAYVDQSLDGALSALDPSDVEVQTAIARLREDCRAAKEALSGDTDTSINVALPGLQTQVRLTRAELEDMVRPRLVETVEALERAVRSAGLTIDQVSRVLLVGGSSRMPIVGEMIRQRTGRPVSVDAHPKFAIALGAAGHASAGATESAAASPAAMITPPPAAAPISAPPNPPAVAAGAGAAPPAAEPAVGVPPQRPAATAPPFAPSPPGTAHAATASPSSPAGGGPDRKKLYVALGAVVVVLLAVVGFVVLGGGDGGTATPSADTDPPPESTEPDDTTERTDDSNPGTNPDTSQVSPSTSIPITPAQFDAALLTPADMGEGFVEGSFIDTGDDFCGELPIHQPVLERSVALDTQLETDDAISIVNTVQYYASTANAVEDLAQGLRLSETCQDQTEVLQGTEFALTSIVTRMDTPLLSSFSPTCLEGAIIFTTFTATNDPNFVVSTRTGLLRCANVLTVVDTSAGPGVDLEEQTLVLTDALSKSANKVSRIPLIP